MGFWARFIFTHPKDFHGFREDEVINVARATELRSISDGAKQGTRTLLVQMAEGTEFMINIARCLHLWNLRLGNERSLIVRGT